MVKYLLEKGADPSIKDVAGNDACAIATHFDQKKVVLRLVTRKMEIMQCYWLRKWPSAFLKEDDFDWKLKTSQNPVGFHHVTVLLCQNLTHDILSTFDEVKVVQFRHLMYTGKLPETSALHVLKIMEISSCLKMENLVIICWKNICRDVCKVLSHERCVHELKTHISQIILSRIDRNSSAMWAHQMVLFNVRKKDEPEIWNTLEKVLDRDVHGLVSLLEQREKELEISRAPIVMNIEALEAPHITDISPEPVYRGLKRSPDEDVTDDVVEK
jgi:hypothetical protein